MSVISSPDADSAAPEPITPELVLVDPELRRQVLAELVQNDALDALAARSARAHAPPRLVVEPLHAPATRHRRTPEAPRRRAATWPKPLRTAAVLPGLVAMSIFAAIGVSEARVSEPTLGPGRTATVPRAPTYAPRSKVRAKLQLGEASVPKGRAVTRRSSAAVERDLLSRIVTSPAGKIPHALIDPTTGLGRNNLQASCRRGAGLPVFRCVVRWAGAPRRSISVRYWPTRDGPRAFTWSWSR